MFATLTGTKKLMGNFRTTNNDDELSLVVDGVNAQIEDHLNRVLISSAQKESFDVSEGTGKVFQLKGYPILTAQDVTEIRIDGDVLSSDNYRLDLTGGRVQIIIDENMPEIPLGISMVEVDYTGGMALDEDSLRSTYKSIVYEANLQSYFEFKRKVMIANTKTGTGDGAEDEYEELVLRRALKTVLRKCRNVSYVR